MPFDWKLLATSPLGFHKQNRSRAVSVNDIYLKYLHDFMNMNRNTQETKKHQDSSQPVQDSLKK